jgi:ribosome modulation factor
MRNTPEGMEKEPLPGIDCLGRDEVRAYTRGYRAGRANHDAKANPYVRGWGGPQERLWVRWSRGWLDGQEDRLLHGC